MDSKKKEGKGALKAGVWYVISNIVVKAISVITTPIFSRLMTTEEYGTVHTFTSWYTLLLPIFTLNLTYSIGRAKLDYPNEFDKYIGSMLTLSGLTSLILSFLAFALIGPVSALFELTIGQSMLLIAYLFFAVATLLYQSGYRFKYKYRQNISIAMYSALTTTILSLILVVAFKGDKADLRMIGVTMPTALLSLFFWGKAIKTKTLSINFEYWKYGLKISAPLILHTISMHILSQSDRIIITKIWGKSDTAFYSLAYTYGMLLHIFTTAAHDGWMPWFHDAYYEGKFDDIKEKVKPLILFCCYIGLASIALAPEIVFILGSEKYAHSIPCVPPIVLGVVCQFIYTQYVSIELHLKKTHYVSAGTIVAALFNVFTNIVFIPVYGFTAAAYTTLACYFLLMIIHYLITKKVLRVHLYNDAFMFCSLFVTGIIAGILMLTYNHLIIRYMLVGIGFVSFLYCFREYIYDWIKKKKDGFD